MYNHTFLLSSENTLMVLLIAPNGRVVMKYFSLFNFEFKFINLKRPQSRVIKGLNYYLKLVKTDTSLNISLC